MKQIRSYIPQYLLRLHEADWHCQCPTCQQDYPFVIIDWQDQRRYSASLSCERVAQDILFNADAFVLHSAEEMSAAAWQPNQLQQKINQGCINLAISDAGDIPVKLYAIGIYINQMMKLSADDVAPITRCGEEFSRLLAQGALAEHFDLLPVISKYKLQAVRALSATRLDTTLDARAGMALSLKLNEFTVLADNYLEQNLTALDQDAQLAAFMQQHRQLWQNFILYRCYHHLFPLNSQDAFLALCGDVYLLKILCGLLIQSEIELDEVRISALFAAMERQPVRLTCDADMLLVGLSLLK